MSREAFHSKGDSVINNVTCPLGHERGANTSYNHEWLARSCGTVGGQEWTVPNFDKLTAALSE